MSNNEIKYRKKIQTTHLKDEPETKALRMRKGNSAQCRLTQECQIIHLNSKCKPNHFYINSMQSCWYNSTKSRFSLILHTHYIALVKKQRKKIIIKGIESHLPVKKPRNVRATIHSTTQIHPAAHFFDPSFASLCGTEG